MILRTPKEHEKDWHSQNTLLSSIRHFRAGGNPGLFRAEIACIPAFAGMTEPDVNWLRRSAIHDYFRRRQEGQEGLEIEFAIFVLEACPRGANEFWIDNHWMMN